MLHNIRDITPANLLPSLILFTSVTTFHRLFFHSRSSCLTCLLFIFFSTLCGHRHGFTGLKLSFSTASVTQKGGRQRERERGRKRDIAVSACHLGPINLSFLGWTFPQGMMTNPAMERCTPSKLAYSFITRCQHQLGSQIVLRTEFSSFLF